MDSDNHIFERDIVLSAEFFAERSGLATPERSLMLAVLEEAARCFLNYGTAEGKQRVLYEEARDWFASSANTELYDFENVCDVLGVDVDYLRRRLFELHDRRRGRAGTTQPKSPAAELHDDWQAAG